MVYTVSTVLAVLAWALLFVGCVRVLSEPALPMPVRPEVTFIRCVPVMICMTEADANKLLKYTQQLDEFEAERARLLK